jgi:hypothetical protein
LQIASIDIARNDFGAAVTIPPDMAAEKPQEVEKPEHNSVSICYC